MEVDTVQIDRFSGLNINAPKDQIGDAELEVAQNVVIRRGAVQKRVGAELVQDLSGEAKTYYHMGMVEADDPEQMDMFFLDRTNTDLYSCRNYVVDDASFTLISNDVAMVLSNIIGFRNGAYCIIQEASDGDVVLGKLTPGNVTKYAIVSSNMQSDLKQHCWVLEHQDRIWVCLSRRVLGDDFDGTVIGFSEPGDFSTVSTLDAAENTVRINGANIIEMQSLGDKIVLFGRSGGIWILNTQGSPRNWSLRQLSQEHELVVTRFFDDSPNEKRVDFNAATLKFGGLIYFIATSGFYVTDGVSIRKLSDPVEPYFGNNPEVTSVPGEAAGTYVTEYSGLCIFHLDYQELFIKIVNKRNAAPKYLIYSIVHDTWTEFVFGVDAPVSALSRDADFISVADPESIPYPYSFASMAYNPKTRTFDGGASLDVGIHFFSNALLTEKNKVYRIDCRSLNPLDYRYFDANGDTYVSRIKTKSFDFGYKGINKKCPKIYFTVRTIDGVLDVNLIITKYVNDVAMATITVVADSDKKHHKIAGPGYFIEHAFQIEDDPATAAINTAFWELQSVSFDLFKKPEQLQTAGVMP